MRAIAIDRDQLLVYEGQRGHGHAVWPAPVLSIATVIQAPEDIDNIPATDDLATKFVFREDSFDPVTRIRRGRMYVWPAGESQPHTWRVQPHPAYPSDYGAAPMGGHGLERRLFGFVAWPAFRELGGPTSRAQIALGIANAFTLWRVVDIERIVTGEDLLTLRARGALGVLPQLNEGAIPKDGREKVFETIGKLADGAHRSPPEAVVDLARAAAQWSSGVWLADKKGEPELRKEELGPLANKLRDEKGLSSHVAHAIARLHSRAKPNEQERRESRPIHEGDAEFALASVGLLLRELGWTAE